MRASAAESAARMGIRAGVDALSRVIQLDWSLPSFPSTLLSLFLSPESSSSSLTIHLLLLSPHLSLLACRCHCPRPRRRRVRSPYSHLADKAHADRTTTYGMCSIFIVLFAVSDADRYILTGDVPTELPFNGGLDSEPLASHSSSCESRSVILLCRIHLLVRG